MVCPRAILALLLVMAGGLGLGFGGEEEPTPPDQPPQEDPFRLDDDQITIRAMHACVWHMPRLFARTAGWDIGWSTVWLRSQTLLCDHDLIADMVHGDPVAIARENLLFEIQERAQATFRSRPCHGLTEADIAAIMCFLQEKGWHMKVVPWGSQDGSYAYAWFAAKELAIPVNRLTDNWMCDRSVVLHEMTHFFQLTSLDDSYHYCRVLPSDVFDQIELAAMIVETAEKMHQGWDLGMFEQNDRTTSPEASALQVFPDVDFLDQPVTVPRIEAGLLLHYMERYGPQFTGDMAQDLFIVRDWVRRFEGVGRIPYGLLPEALQRDLTPYIRLQEATGQVDALNSTCQTWLAINGAPSIYDHVQGQPSPVATYPLPVLTVEESMAAMPADLPEENLRRAREFLESLRSPR